MSCLLKMKGLSNYQLLKWDFGNNIIVSSLYKFSKKVKVKFQFIRVVILKSI